MQTLIKASVKQAVFCIPHTSSTAQHFTDCPEPFTFIISCKESSKTKQVSERQQRDSRSQVFLGEASGLPNSGELQGRGGGRRRSLAMNLLYSMGLLSIDHYVPAEGQMDHVICSLYGKITGPIRKICTQLKLMES